MIDAVPVPSRRSSVAVWTLTSAGAVLVAAIYLLRLDHVAGLIVDDGWYVLFAQALARGDGFTLINSPIPGLLPAYPPGWPALMSLVFLWAPDFPSNVPLLKGLSIAAMFAIAPIAWRYFRARGLSSPQAAGVALAVVITPAFVFLATSTLMSECVFTLALLAGTLMGDRGVNGPHPTRDTIVAGAISAAAVLIRSAGLPFPIAIGLLLVWRRRWRQALLFAATCALCLAPWWWYAATHAAPRELRAAHGGAQVWSYGEQFWMHWAGDASTGAATIGDLPARVGHGLFDVFGRDLGAIVLPTLYRGAFESGQEVISVGGGLVPASMGNATGTMIVSGLLALVMSIGYARAWRRGATVAELVIPLSLALTVTWPFWAYRFVLPLAPFLYFYLVSGLEVLAGEVHRARVVRIVLMCVIVLNLGDHALYIAQSRNAPQEWVADAQEVDALFDWMRTNLTTPGLVASSNPALVYLRAGRQGVALDGALDHGKRWKAMGVRYLVSLRPVELPFVSVPYTVLYKSPRLGLWIVEI
jgi:hypothetical protein